MLTRVVGGEKNSELEAKIVIEKRGGTCSLGDMWVMCIESTGRCFQRICNGEVNNT